MDYSRGARCIAWKRKAFGHMSMLAVPREQVPPVLVAVPVTTAPQHEHYRRTALQQLLPAAKPVGWGRPGEDVLEGRDLPTADLVREGGAGRGFHHWILNPPVGLGSPTGGCSSLLQQF